MKRCSASDAMTAMASCPLRTASRQLESGNEPFLEQGEDADAIA